MKIQPVLLILLILTISCGGTKKSRINPVDQNVTIENTRPDEDPAIKEPPIIEVKEKLVPVDNKPPDPNHYFVIIGSFRSQDNAQKHQEQIASDGFVSVLLRNEAGLFRVSVLSSEDITTARNEIRRIRNLFKKYEDTWLLIREN